MAKNKTKRMYLKEIKDNLLIYSGVMALYEDVIRHLLKERFIYRLLISILILIGIVTYTYLKKIGG